MNIPGISKLCLIVIATVAMVCLYGCGKGSVPPPTAGESQPFNKPIEDYLKSKNMGMAVSGFDKLQVDGDKAKAICKMQEAENLYGMRITWEFDFQKQKDGWKVTGHTVK